MGKKTFAIIGASLAGAHAAHQLRKDGFDGRILLIGDEPHLPYDRPPLSKATLQVEVGDSASYLWPEADYEQAEITPLLSTRVDAIDRGRRSLQIGDGRTIAFDKLLLCTGARARALPISVPPVNSISCLRTLDDAMLVRDRLNAGGHILVVGFGFIGAEVAAAARKRGCAVTLIEAGSLPLLRILGSEAALRYCTLHRDQGVDVKLNTSVEQISHNGTTNIAKLSDGSVIEADAIIYGIGSIANADLARSAGIDVGNGIIVNQYCETSMTDIYASGDVACRPSAYADGHIRLESWQNAYKQGVAAARSMLGIREEFDDLPWFWSDQYDLRMQLAGLPAGHDQVVWRGNGDDGLSGSAFYLTQGRVTAVLGLNRPRDVRSGMNLIRSQSIVDADTLRDSGTDLNSLC